MGYKIIECESLQPKKSNTSEQDTFSIPTELSNKERKFLIDSLVDPTFVILNANYVLKKKLEKFLDEATRENFYMIERSSQKLIDSINQLRNTLNSASD